MALTGRMNPTPWITAGVAIVTLLGAVIWMRHDWSHRSDEAMAAHFRASESVFRDVLAKIQNGTWDDEVTEACRSLGLAAVYCNLESKKSKLRQFGEREVTLDAPSLLPLVGMSTAGVWFMESGTPEYAKGYVWLGEPPLAHEKRDSLERRHAPGGTSYLRISGSWFLFRQDR